MAKCPQEITKPLIMRTVELVRALQIIADSCKAVRAGRVHQFIPLSGQLRALLTDRAKKSDPLLFKLADLLAQPLDVYVEPRSGFPVTLKQELPTQLKMPLKEFLQHSVLKYKDQAYTAKTVIEWFANWTGGAHYSRLLPANLAELLAFTPKGLQPAAIVLLQIGEAVLAAGRDLLQRLVNMELHCVVAIPALPKAPTVLFDSVYPRTSMRWSLLVHSTGRLEFQVYGGQGVSTAVFSDGIVDWSQFHHIHAGVTIDDDLTTVVEISVDGVRAGRMRSREPLFIDSDPLHYDFYHNRAVDGDAQQFSFALGMIMILSRELDPGPRAHVFLLFEERRKEQDAFCLVYEPGSFGRAMPGTTDVTMSGTVNHVRMRDVVLGTNRIDH